MKLVFWSLEKGHSHVTSAASALASYFAVGKKKKTSLYQIEHFWNNELQIPFIDTTVLTKDTFQNTGMDALLRSVKAGGTDLSAYKGCAFSYFDKNLDLYMPSLADNAQVYYTELGACFKQLMDCVDSTSTISCIDNGHGSGPGGLYLNVVREADVIIVCLPQNINKINRFFNSAANVSSNFFFLIMDYDTECGINASAIKKRFKQLKDNNFDFIRHSSEFADAFMDSTLPRFFYSNIENNKNDVNYEFIKDCSRVCDKILKMKPVI